MIGRFVDCVDYGLLLTVLKRKMVTARPCATLLLADRNTFLAAGRPVVAWFNGAILRSAVSLG